MFLGQRAILDRANTEGRWSIRREAHDIRRNGQSGGYFTSAQEVGIVPA
jgi:hypothetical protein